MCSSIERAQTEVNTSVVFMNSNEQFMFVLFSIIHPGTPGQILHSYFLIKYLSVKIFCIKNFERQRNTLNTWSMQPKECRLRFSIPGKF